MGRGEVERGTKVPISYHYTTSTWLWERGREEGGGVGFPTLGEKTHRLPCTGIDGHRLLGRSGLVGVLWRVVSAAVRSIVASAAAVTVVVTAACELSLKIYSW
jgi:hypothetical protein